MNRRKFLGYGYRAPVFLSRWGAVSFISCRSAKAAPWTMDGVPSGGRRRKPKSASGTLYRPKATVVSPSPTVVFETSNPVVQMVIDFHVTKGFVAKIDLFVNGKKRKSFPVAGEMAHGRIKVTYDFSALGAGTHKVKVIPVNGSPGHQSARGWPLKSSLKVKVTS